MAAECDESSLSPPPICRMQIQNLYLPVGEVVPILDGKPARDMHLHSATNRITFRIVGVAVGRSSNFPKAPQQVALFARA